MKNICLLFLSIFLSIQSMALFIWNGAVDSDWNNTGNWSGNVVPSSTDDVTIAAGSAYYPVILSNIACYSLTLDAGASLIINSGSLNVTGSSYINGTLTIASAKYDSDGNFNATNGVIDFTGAGFLELGSTVSSLGTLDATIGTVVYDGVTQTVVSDNYYNLEIINTGTKTAGGDLDVDGDLTTAITSTCRLDLFVFKLNIAGDLNIGAYSGLIAYDFLCSIIIDGTSSQDFYSGASTISNLTMSGTDLTLGDPLEMTGVLTLNNGYIISTSTNGLSLRDGAQVFGASNSSHVIGPMNVETSSQTDYLFPLGDGINYRPAIVKPGGSSLTMYSAAFIKTPHSSISNGSSLCGAGINHVGSESWWNIKREQGIEDCYIALNWDANSGVDVPADMILAYYNNVIVPLWDMSGNFLSGSDGTGSPTSSDGRATSNTLINNFGAFNLASSSCGNPLNGSSSTIQLSISVLDANCNGFCDGTATANVSGGSPPYTFSWTDPSSQTTQTAIGLCAGSYTVTVTDTKGCTAIDSKTVSEPTVLSISTYTTDPVCYGGCDGQAISSPIGGTAGYTFSWTDPSSQTIQTAIGLCAGTYDVVVTDANGCLETQSCTLNDPSPPPVEAGLNQFVCEGEIVTLSGSGVVSYIWDNSVLDGVSFLPSLGTSSYNVIGTDADGCSAVDSVDVTVYSLPPIYGGLDQTVCLGNAVILTGSGGVSYTWDNGVVDAVTFIPALGALTYTVVGTDANGCTETDMVDVRVDPVYSDTTLYNLCFGSTITLSGQSFSSSGTHYAYDSLATINGCDSVLVGKVVIYSPVSINSNITHVSCPGYNDGAIDLTVTGPGTNNYIWSNGSALEDQNDLIAGTYSVNVINSLGCDKYEEIVVDQPTEIQTDYVIANPSCGANDGDVYGTVLTLYDPPYYFHWSNGDLTDTAYNISAGPITVMIRDASGCEFHDVVLIGNNTGPSVGVNNVIHESCPGASDGEIDLHVSSNFPPYTINWLCGGNTEIISGLPGGDYQYIVEDQSSCIVTGSVIVNSPDTINITSINIMQPNCGNQDGDIEVIATGGAVQLDYLWDASTGSQTGNYAASLGAGVYNVVISDQNNCSVSENIELNDNSSIAISLASVIQPGCGQLGSINVNVNGGNMPYAFQWSNGSNTEDINGLTSGNYNLQLTDDQGCVAVLDQSLEGMEQLNNGICLATVDTTNNYNMIVWEKPLTAESISHYNIYRECCFSGVYNYLTSVPYDSLSQYQDTIADADFTSWGYRLSVVDTCGVESMKSALHRTIHLQCNEVAANSVELAWNVYTGFAYSMQYIYRYHPTTGWELIDSVSAVATIYYDFAPPLPLSELIYSIEVTAPSTCTSTKAVDHNSTRSNRGAVVGGGGPQSISAIQTGNIHVYPNPTNNKLTVELNQIELPCNIIVKDIRGSVVYSTIANSKKLELDLSNYEKGIYLIGITNPNFTRELKVVKQ